MRSFHLSRRLAATTATVFVVLGVATSAHARNDVTFSIGIHVPGVYVQTAPVYTPPPRIIYQPRTVYVQPAPIYVQPRPVFVQPPAYGVHYRSGPDWHRNQWDHGHRHGHRPHGGKHGGRRD